MSELTIPESAIPVVEILRRDVKRPKAGLVKDGADESQLHGKPRWGRRIDLPYSVLPRDKREH